MSISILQTPAEFGWIFSLTLRNWLIWKRMPLLQVSPPFYWQIKTESTRSSSNKWTKTSYQDYLHCIANFFSIVLNIFSKQFISSNTKRRKRMLNFLWNTWNETDDEILPVFAQISELWHLFSLVPVGICFRCYFRQLFMYLALRKCKNDCKLCKIITDFFLITDFCPLRPEIGRFSIGFCLKTTQQKLSKRTLEKNNGRNASSVSIVV